MIRREPSETRTGRWFVIPWEVNVSVNRTWLARGATAVLQDRLDLDPRVVLVSDIAEGKSASERQWRQEEKTSRHSTVPTTILCFYAGLFHEKPQQIKQKKKKEKKGKNWRRAGHARQFCSKRQPLNSLRWPIYLINSVDNTKLPW